MFCSRPCLSKWRKDHVFTGGTRSTTVYRTDEQKKQDKRDYDKIYRAKNRDKIKARKKAYYQKNKDKIESKMKILRKTPEYKAKRRKYLSTDKYKNYKHKYDREHRCKKNYGEFWEAASILIDLENEVRPHKYETRKTNKTINKAQQRRRKCKSLMQST